MGERLSGDGVPGRRGVHPGDAVSAPWDVWDEHDDIALETTLATVMRDRDLAPEAEQRAVVAFRATRDTDAPGAYPAPGRLATARGAANRAPCEDDVRRRVRQPRPGWCRGRGHRFGRLVHGRRRCRPGDRAPVVSPRPGRAVRPRRAPTGGGPTDGPAAAQDTEAHCRAYEHVKDRGKALDSTAWQRLVAAAGGEDKVAAYCAERLARATAAPGKSVGTGKPSEGPRTPARARARRATPARRATRIPATTPTAQKTGPAMARQAAGRASNRRARRRPGTHRSGAREGVAPRVSRWESCGGRVRRK
jgi:hypothetical protein